MLCRDLNLACFQQKMGNTDIAIVEGVMGLYDGRDGKSDVGSTAEMAKLLSAPVLLVLDCWALARSAAAIIHGYTTFDPALKFAGVVFNKVLTCPTKSFTCVCLFFTKLGHFLSLFQAVYYSGVM